MSVVLYWLAIRIYGLLIRIAALFNPKAKLFVKGRKDLLRDIRYSLFDEKRPRIWVHCASLGEFEQGRPLIEKLRVKYATHAIVLTFFSPSGYEVRKAYPGADYVFYLPLDSPYNAHHFIKTVQPSLALFVKYELWYFFLMRLSALNIPVILVSAIFRKSQPYFQWYGGLHRKMLQVFSHIFVQDTTSVQMLKDIGVKDVTVGGDTRFDRVADAVVHKYDMADMSEFCKDSRIIIAGSTWKEDEVLLKQVFDKLPAKWKLVIVPHETDIAHMKEVMELHEGDAVLWSRFKIDYYDQRVLLIDSVGLLLRLYQYADVAYVGGGFNKSGIHNLLEAAVYGKPIFHGPVYHKFKEANDLLKVGATVVADKPDTVLQQILLWEKDRISYNAACVAARKYVLGNTGATHKIINYIDGKHLLSSE